VLIDRITGIEDSSRYWSLFIDHLRIVDQGVTKIVEALGNDRLFDWEVRIQDVKPSADAGPGVIDQFVKSLAAYEATVKRLGKLRQHRVRHPHPWFGPMTAHDWHCLVGMHHRIHRRQCERIKQLLEKA
jgi:hypothetical protein